MKVTINGEDYETSADWTFREELEVKRLTRLLPGEVFPQLLSGATLPVVALAVVGHMRAKPGMPCDFLLDLKPGDEVVLDLSDGDREESVEGLPPTKKSGGRTSPRSK